MAINIFPTAVALGEGGLDGALRNSDQKNGRANPDGSMITGKFPWALGYEIALLAGGALADIMRMSRDLSEPSLYLGAGLLGQRTGHALAQGATITTPHAFATPYWGTPARADLVRQQSPEAWLGV